MCFFEFWDIFWLFRNFLKYDVIEWCIDVLHEIWNDLKLWSKYSIFRKGNTVLRLLLVCIDLWVSYEWDDPDSTNIMESHRWSYSVSDNLNEVHLVESEVWKNLSEQIKWIYPVRWYWDDYAHDCVNFTTSNMTCAGLWMLISLHESSGSRVKCLCVMSQSLTWERWIWLIDTWWLCGNAWEFMALCEYLKFYLY